MNSFEKLLDLPAAEKKKLGLEHTPAEIAQQPSLWLQTVELLKEKSPAIQRFLAASGLKGQQKPVVIMTGAGSSEFVGSSIAGEVGSRWQTEVLSIPTTTLVTHAAAAFVPGREYLLISFARSGDTPESTAALKAARRAVPGLKHIVITCNKSGKLANSAAGDTNSLGIVLPERANDRSLAMTSAFSSMALAGIALTYMDAFPELETLAGRVAAAASGLLKSGADTLYNFAEKEFYRACYLGSGALLGLMQECALKMLEMTNGQIATLHNSFLGVRHGPRAFIRDDCVVLAFVSSDPLVQRYELDLLRSIKEKRQGCGTLTVCGSASRELREASQELIELFPGSEPALDEGWRILTDVRAGRKLATAITAPTAPR